MKTSKSNAIVAREIVADIDRRNDIDYGSATNWAANHAEQAITAALDAKDAEWEQRVKDLEWQVANWERKEISRASCCADNEQRVRGLSADNAKLREALEFYANPESKTFCKTEYEHRARAALASLPQKEKGRG